MFLLCRRICGSRRWLVSSGWLHQTSSQVWELPKMELRTLRINSTAVQPSYARIISWHLDFEIWQAIISSQPHFVVPQGFSQGSASKDCSRWASMKNRDPHTLCSHSSMRTVEPIPNRPWWTRFVAPQPGGAFDILRPWEQNRSFPPSWWLMYCGNLW